VLSRWAGKPALVCSSFMRRERSSGLTVVCLGRVCAEAEEMLRTRQSSVKAKLAVTFDL
jgi:hypothetical protein